MATEHLSQQLAVIASIPPAGSATGTSTSDVIDLDIWGRVLFLVQAGAQTTTGNLSASVLGGTVTGTVTSSVQTVDFGANKDNLEWLIEVRDQTAGYRYIKLVLKQETATGFRSAVALAGEARYHPASDNDLASVTSITIK